MTAQPASPEPETVVDHVERTCTCGETFTAEIRAIVLDQGARGTRRLAMPGPRLCPSCRNRQASDAAAREQADRDAEAERIRREDIERFQLAVPAKYRHADPRLLAPGLLDALGDYGARPTSLYIHGPYGTGKTYAAAALVKACWNRSIRSGAWANVPILLDQLRRSIRKPDITNDQIERLCNAPLAVLDDIGAEKPSEWVVDRLYVVVNHRYENELPTIVTSNLRLSELGDRIGMRIASRLVETATQFELAGDDRRLFA